MRQRLTACFAATLFLVVTGARAEQGPDDPPSPGLSGPRTLAVGLADDTPPFSGSGRFGVHVGFDVDIALAICSRLEFRCRLLPLPEEEMASALRERRVDLLIASDGRISDLSESVARSQPYVSLTARHVVRRDHQADEAAQTPTHGAIINTPYARYLQETHSQAAITLYDRTDEMWIDLALGRLDTVLSTAIAARDEFLGTPLGAGFQLDPRPLEDPAVASRDAAIVLRQTDSNLLAGVNEALSDLLETAEYREILERHLAGGLAHRPIPARRVDAR